MGQRRWVLPIPRDRCPRWSRTLQERPDALAGPPELEWSIDEWRRDDVLDRGLGSGECGRSRVGRRRGLEVLGGRLDRPLGSRRCRGRRDTSVGQRFVWAPRLGVALVRLQCRGGRGESRGADQEREHRQFGVVDGEGRSATYTGTECLPWAGGIVGDGFSCQGNVVAGPGVVDAMAEVFAGPGDLGARLLAALHAGDRAGGDRRGDNRRRFWWFAMVVGTSAART